MAACLRFLVITSLVCSVAQFAVGAPSNDVVALQELLRAWQGAPAVLDTWSVDEDADPCGSGWKGVVCSPTKSVVNLHLSGANLSGGIPAAIGGLEELTILDLSGNPELTSSIPRQLGHLRRLTHLKLSACNFSGKVPEEIYNLNNLEYLDLSNNPHLLLDRDAEELMSLRQQSLTFSRRRLLHHRRLLQTTRRTPLPIFYTYIALAAVGVVALIVFTFCFCRWLSVRKTRHADTFFMAPGPPTVTSQNRTTRIHANENAEVD